MRILSVIGLIVFALHLRAGTASAEERDQIDLRQDPGPALERLRKTAAALEAAMPARTGLPRYVRRAPTAILDRFAALVPKVGRDPMVIVGDKQISLYATDKSSRISSISLFVEGFNGRTTPMVSLEVNGPGARLIEAHGFGGSDIGVEAPSVSDSRLVRGALRTRQRFFWPLAGRGEWLLQESYGLRAGRSRSYLLRGGHSLRIADAQASTLRAEGIAPPVVRGIAARAHAGKAPGEHARKAPGEHARKARTRARSGRGGRVRK